MAVLIKARRGTASEWTSTNPVLAGGEVGLETDTGNIKYGDGATTWTALGYSGEGIKTDGTYDTDTHGILWRVRLTGSVDSTDTNLVQVDENGTPVYWWNERGFSRGLEMSNHDALLRAFQDDDRTTEHAGVGYCMIELLTGDREEQVWGINWVDGAQIYNGVKHDYVLHWVSGVDPDPTTDTTGRFGYGQYLQVLEEYSWVHVYLEEGDTKPSWTPDGRTTIHWMDPA